MVEKLYKIKYDNYLYPKWYSEKGVKQLLRNKPELQIYVYTVVLEKEMPGRELLENPKLRFFNIAFQFYSDPNGASVGTRSVIISAKTKEAAEAYINKTYRVMSILSCVEIFVEKAE